MIKLIIFDLDGVLVDAKEIHYRTLNDAIKKIAGEEFVITESEHLSIYDGLKTYQKLDMLTSQKKLEPLLHTKIWEEKQTKTIEEFENLTINKTLISTFKQLREDGFLIACCSNSIRRSVIMMLSKIGVIEFIDLILSNEDVITSKPHPEIYWKCMSTLKVLPEETLIVEDSPYGLLSAKRSNANVLRVNSPSEVDYNSIFKKIMELNLNKKNETPKWEDNKLNVLIPMAGAGSRFRQLGYKLPKPLIDVNGKPMIQVVVENLNINANYIYVVQKSHRIEYNLDVLLNMITPNCKIVEVDGITDGAACTALMARDFINNDNPLFFANSDQYVEWDSNDFMYKMNEIKPDGGIVTFKDTHPKWSFAKIDNNGYVTEVAEKNPISENATVGFYYWKHGSDFVKYAEEMINNNVRVNNEFYVCPVFNFAINDDKKIKNYQAKGMWGLGTPEDLKNYLKSTSSLDDNHVS